MISKTIPTATCLVGALLIAFAIPSKVAGEGFKFKPGQRVIVQTKESSSAITVGYFAGLSNGTLFVTSNGDVSIDRAITVGGDTVSFPYAGARYDAGTDSLSGLNADGDTVSLAVSDVYTVDVAYISGGRRQVTVFDRDMVRTRFRFGAKYPVVSAFPIESIQYLRVRTQLTIAPLVGVIAGGTIGYLVGTTEEDDPPSWFDFGFPLERLSREDKMVRDILIGTVAGGAVGYLIGKPQWRDVPVGQLTLSVTPQLQGGPGLSLALKF